MSAVQLRRWTREEYDRMIDAGVFNEDENVELVDGEIVTMTPQNSPHATATTLAGLALQRVFGDAGFVRTRLPLALDPASEPEPDLVVVIGSPRDYNDHHPTTALLIVEVADSSLAFHRTTKARVYARAGIADYWIINLVDRVLEVRRSPAPSIDSPHDWGYAIVEHLAAGDRVAPLERPDHAIAVSDLLP